MKYYGGQPIEITDDCQSYAPLPVDCIRIRHVLQPVVMQLVMLSGAIPGKEDVR